jgi:phosphoribosyl-ATP pyrophosphohydrolase/phosphoribosyl-AMP cyclohydrolase
MTPDFSKTPDGLIPAVVQDAETRQVLMLGYMDTAAFEATRSSGNVWFYSRSRQRLWMKGEQSGNVLHVASLVLDCDRDTILVTARPAGPTCHTGADTCFGETRELPFLQELEAIIAQRKADVADAGSYTASLFRRGINTIAQKVGEEAIELIIEAKDDDDVRFRNEAADLLFHYLVLLQAKGFRLSDIEAVLRERNR